MPIETEFNILQISRCMESGNTTPVIRVLFGPTIANYQKWQKAWARSINPDSICEDKYYSADPEPGSESVYGQCATGGGPEGPRVGPEARLGAGRAARLREYMR